MGSPFDDLAEALARIPGLGHRSAERAALSLIRKREKLLLPLIDSLIRARDVICTCEHCGAITTVGNNPCLICSDARRNASLLCVVEEPGDIMTIERSGAFNGLYHVLYGRISPMQSSGPENIRLKELEQRIEKESISEIILAIGTDVEGDATASYIIDSFSKYDIAITRLARGLPVDSGIGFSDPVTLRRAIMGRN